MGDAKANSRGHIDKALANGLRLLSHDPAASVAQAREILSIDPINGDALRLLGKGFRRLGRIPEAEQAELDAIKVSAHNRLLVEAAQAITGNRLEAAERLLRPYLEANPEDAAATRMLAEIAIRVGADTEAEVLLRRVLDLAPAFTVAHSRLATILFRQNRPAESIAVLDELLDRDADNLNARSSKAAALGRIGDYREALALYEEMLAHTPENPQLWMSYGHVLKTIGRPADSIAAYRHATDLDPGFGEAWWSLANLKTAKLDKDDVASMRAALAKGAIGDDSALQIHFALGKALEDAKEYEDSFAHYARGNRIRRAMLPYDSGSTTDLVDQSIAMFTRAFFADRKDVGLNASAPIFILGMPRAGSTLIEQILSSHSNIEGTSELPIVPTMAQQMNLVGARGQPIPYPGALAALPADDFAALGEEYLRSAAPYRKTGKPFFIDKLPNNWAHIGFIHLMLPNARIVDARRHPLGCGFSNFKQHFARGQAFAYSQRDIGLYYRDYVRLTAHFDAVLPGRVHRVLHERMVADPEAEIRALLDYLGLPFEDACLRFHENDRAVRTPSAEQVRQPINSGGLDQWHAYEAWLGEMKEALGPVLEFYPEAPPVL